MSRAIRARIGRLGFKSGDQRRHRIRARCARRLGHAVREGSPRKTRPRINTAWRPARPSRRFGGRDSRAARLRRSGGSSGGCRLPVRLAGRTADEAAESRKNRPRRRHRFSSGRGGQTARSLRAVTIGWRRHRIDTLLEVFAAASPTGFFGPVVPIQPLGSVEFFKLQTIVLAAAYRSEFGRQSTLQSHRGTDPSGSRSRYSSSQTAILDVDSWMSVEPQDDFARTCWRSIRRSHARIVNIHIWAVRRGCAGRTEMRRACSTDFASAPGRNGHAAGRAFAGARTLHPQWGRLTAT